MVPWVNECPEVKIVDSPDSGVFSHYKTHKNQAYNMGWDTLPEVKTRHPKKIKQYSFSLYGDRQNWQHPITEAA